MSQENKEFYDLLNQLVSEQTFEFELSNGTATQCKQLTTMQLKELVKAVVDSPITQSRFNLTASNIFSTSLLTPLEGLTTVDRLLFLLETRIHSIGNVSTVVHNENPLAIDFSKIKQTLLENITKNIEKFQTKTIDSDNISLKIGVPSIKTDSQLCEEIYKNSNINIEDIDELRKVIGEAFVNEIAKTIETITIKDKTLDLSAQTFKSRLKTVESLPASLIQKVIEYIEDYKKIVDESLTVEGYLIPVDGSLFSLQR